MLSKALEEAINEQIKNELYSAYLYLSMSAYFEAENLSGMARWMRLQSDEEVSHAMKFFDYLYERGGRVVLQAIHRIISGADQDHVHLPHDSPAGEIVLCQ